jgi:hypothetical protein
MLVARTMILAQLLSRSPWRMALVTALGGVSVERQEWGLEFVLAMLGTRVDLNFLTQKLHRQGGIIYFLLSNTHLFRALACASRRIQNKTLPESFHWNVRFLNMEAVTFEEALTETS